eukprot:178735_1
MSDKPTSLNDIVSKYAGKFDQSSPWKKAAITGAVLTTGCMFYSMSSYYLYKLWYNKLPLINYKITGDINNNSGILFFIHGWPDTSALWNPQVKYLSNNNYCCITLDLPNLNLDIPLQNPWGYNLMQVVDALGNTIQKILNDNNKTAEGIHVISHDWGSYLAELLYIHYKTKIKINKLVLLDVGDGGNDDKAEQYKYSYQMVNAIMFLMPRTFGTWYLKRYYKKLLSKRGIMIPTIRDNIHKFDSCQGYLYFYVIKTIFFGSKKQLGNIMVRGKLNEFDNLPVLFIDATKGWHYPVQYYSNKFKQYLEDRDDCEFVEFDCYHWIQDEKIGLPQKLNETIHQFIQK